MLSHSPLARFFCTTLVIICAFTFASTGMGQSGRRGTKTQSAPVPLPKTTTVTKPGEKPKPALTLIVGMERSDTFGDPRVTSIGSVLLSFSDRLDDNPSVKVDQVRLDMRGSAAIHRARTEKEAYVVLLRLRTYSMVTGKSENGQFCIQYWVFAPTTAKLKTSGQTSPQMSRNRGVNPNSRNIYGDLELQKAAREAAERILAAFNLPAPDSAL
jgi:hypothetical protein